MKLCFGSVVSSTKQRKEWKMDARKRNTIRVASGAALAAAAASLFLSGSIVVSSANAEEAKVQCAGVNSCKGKSECSSAKNGCSGQNACKGQGWRSMTEKQCLEKDAKVQKSRDAFTTPPHPPRI